jgi:hypothetical protein
MIDFIWLYYCDACKMLVATSHGIVLSYEIIQVFAKFTCEVRNVVVMSGLLVP